MRFKSTEQSGYTVYAVTGVNTVSFAIEFDNANTDGLLGFAVQREDPVENEKYYMYGFKVFKELMPAPGEDIAVTTFDNPVQSFVWDDFTAKPGRQYTYYFHPVKGKPKNLEYEAPVAIAITTEKDYDEAATHDVFFNRGVAGSQAYTRRFGNDPIDKLTPEKRAGAFEWLSRELDDAIYKFIAQAQPGDTLLGCFYEFHYVPVVQALKDALDRGVLVRLVIDAKDNHVDDKPATPEDESKAAFPRDVNIETITNIGLDDPTITKRRTANKSYIQHNKFMVYLPQNAGTKAVWTGSTNISQGGIMGQTNVGHWIKDDTTADLYKAYWELLNNDPGSAPNGEDAREMNSTEYREANKSLTPDFEFTSFNDIADGITPVFSPRKEITMLQNYAKMLDETVNEACITLAFGVNNEFKDLLKDNTADDQISFLLLEKEDLPDKDKPDEFVKLGYKNNVYEAFGSYIKEPIYDWVKETNAGNLGLNHHVSYIHSKFLLADPLSASPVIVSGSANFSAASTQKNDENMVIIKGDRRAADIYFTEFMRLFNHYYFRAVLKNTHNQPETSKEESLFLRPDSTWVTEKYKPGSLRYKRVQMFVKMELTEQV